MKKILSVLVLLAFPALIAAAHPHRSESPLSFSFSDSASVSVAAHLPSPKRQDSVQTRTGDESDSTAADSSGEMNEKQIAEILERAREHYLLALQAQAEGDTTMSADEFEETIKHLNEASYYPNIEENTDFNELTRSVIEDYEKYIATIDSLGANSSVFALREKLNMDIEKIDITNITIPPSLIPKTDVPLHINEYTKRTLAFFMGKGRHHMENWIYRSGKYFPIMSRIFQEEGLPQELMLLSLPESGLNPTARSWAKAVGLWQFMKATGGLYGLRSTYWYDERRDFEKATRAAARHMKDLYAEFNDWHLVFVAYNAGSGWVRKGIRRSGSTDYWEMRKKLPRETRNYVPQYIATALIILRPEAFGFGDIEKADSLSFETVTVDDCVDLGILAECAGTDLETIKDLNPELTQWCTPPNYKGYRFRIPVGTTAQFMENYAKIPEEKKLDFATHTIRRGETVAAIATKYKVTKQVLLEVNHLSKSKRLKVGAVLVIPVKASSAAAIVEAQKDQEKRDIERANKLKEEGRKFTPSPVVASTESASPKAKTKRPVEKTYEPQGREKVTYVVKSGESLGLIAEWFNVRASHIRNWNNIPYGRHIYKGQKLAIWVPEEKLEYYKNIAAQSFAEKQHGSSAVKKKNAAKAVVPGEGWTDHKVKKGETLEKIAAHYDVAIADLKSWNKLKTSRINAGTMLTVYAPDHTEDPADDPAPKKSAAKTTTAKTSAAPAKAKAVTYVVKKGDTLEKIAEKYSTTVQDLKKMNDLRSGKIIIGQKLKVQS